MVEEDRPKVVKGDGNVVDVCGVYDGLLVVVLAVVFFTKERMF